MAKVTMPQLGESVAEGTIGKWLKQPGDTVEKYEPLLEVITDKVNAEVPSPFAGVLKEILVEEGRDRPEQRRDRHHRDGRREQRHERREGGGASSRPPRQTAPAAEPANGPAGADERPAARGGRASAERSRAPARHGARTAGARRSRARRCQPPPRRLPPP